MQPRYWSKFLLCASLLLAAPASAQNVKAGIDAWQRGDYVGAVAIWRPLAEAGDPDASFNMGQAYRLGRGVLVDLATAQTWRFVPGSTSCVSVPYFGSCSLQPMIATAKSAVARMLRIMFIPTSV